MLNLTCRLLTKPEVSWQLTTPRQGTCEKRDFITGNLTVAICTKRTNDCPTRLKLGLLATYRIREERGWRGAEAKACLVRLRNRFVGLGIFGIRSGTQNPYVDKYTYVGCVEARVCLYPAAEVTYDSLVRFPYMSRRVYFSRGGGAKRGIHRYWKPSKRYEKLKRFAKSAEIWQPYSPGLVYQILLRDTGIAIPLQRALFRNAARSALCFTLRELIVSPLSTLRALR